MKLRSGMSDRRRSPFGRLLAAGLAASVVAAVGGAAAAAEQGQWRQFRGPGGSGVAEAKGLPTRWTETDNVVWKAKLPGPGTSSPIVVGDAIYLTCFTGYNVPGESDGVMTRLRRRLVCVDAGTGKVRWTTEMAARQPEQARIRDDHGYASSTPASDGERLYVFAGKSGVFAFDLAGKQLWQTDVGSGLSGWGSAASPVLTDKLVIVNASVESGSLVALDKSTGKQVWKADGIKESWNTPLLVPLKDGKTELAVAVPRQVICLDPASGEKLWTCETDITWYMVPSMVAHDGVVYCIGGRSGKAASLAVRAGGRGDVTDTHRLWRTERYSNVSSPIYYDGRLYFAHEQKAIAYCLNAKTGEVVYEEPLGPRAGQVYASPVLADGKIYYVTRRGGVYVVAAKPAFELLAHNSLGDRSTFNASPAVAGNRLLIRSDTYLYCLGDK